MATEFNCVIQIFSSQSVLMVCSLQVYITTLSNSVSHQPDTSKYIISNLHMFMVPSNFYAKISHDHDDVEQCKCNFLDIQSSMLGNLPIFLLW